MKIIYKYKLSIPSHLFTFFLALLLFLPPIQARAGKPDLPPKIVISTVAVSVWNDGSGKAGAQLLLKNIGRSSARELKVTDFKINHGKYFGPATLPAFVGDIAAGEDKLFDSIIKVPIDGKESQIILKGTYMRNNGQGDKLQVFVATYLIAPSAALPGPITSTPGQAVKQSPENTSYPPASPPASFGPNAETPMFIPIGPQRLLSALTDDPSYTTGSDLGTSAGGALVRIPTNTSSGNAGVPPDPNASSNAEGDVVLSTYNTGISYSVNGGASFTDVNLFSAAPGNPSRTSFFP